MPRILIVEDEATVANVLEDFLDGLGYQTEVVLDGQQAVARAQQAPPDLIIMDLVMPHLTGGEAARMLRQDTATARIPILAISGIPYAQELEDVLLVDAILTKPFDLGDLSSQVHAMLPAAPPEAPSTAAEP